MQLNRKGLGWFQPAPSVFDFCISFILIINVFRQKFHKEIFFVFYVFFLLILTFMTKQKRDYKNIWISILACWSLLGVFIHSYILSQESIVFRYKNMYLMSEGFIYILTGAILLFIIVRYATNLKFLYVLFPVLLIPWFHEFYHEGIFEFHLTPFIALFISILIYLIIKKRFIISSLLVSFGVFFSFANWQYVGGKFVYKIPVIKQILSLIFRHPFVGTGFNKTLSPDNMIQVPHITNNAPVWLWRYNDFLNITSQLGILAFICCVFFIMGTARKIGKEPRLILFIAMVLMMSAQSIMPFVDKAVTYLLLTGLFIIESYKKEEQNVV